MKNKTVSISIIISAAIVMFCIAPCSYWNPDKMIYSALFYNMAVVIIGVLCLFWFNTGNVKAIASTIFISLSTYFQLLVGLFLYQYGSIYYLLLLFMQLLFGLAIMKSAPNDKSIVVMLFNLLASTIWANKIAGFMYYSNISSDLETIGVSSLITGISAIIVSVISICCICMSKQTE